MLKTFGGCFVSGLPSTSAVQFKHATLVNMKLCRIKALKRFHFSIKRMYMMSTDHNGGAASCPSFRVILYDSEQRLLPFTKEN